MEARSIARDAPRLVCPVFMAESFPGGWTEGDGRQSCVGVRVLGRQGLAECSSSLAGAAASPCTGIVRALPIDHLGFEVSDLARSARFYDAVFHALGSRRMHEGAAAVAYGTDEPTFWI